MILCELIILIIQKPGWDFGVDCEPLIKVNKGAHGSLSADQMLVPFIIKGKIFSIFALKGS